MVILKQDLQYDIDWELWTTMKPNICNKRSRLVSYVSYYEYLNLFLNPSLYGWGWKLLCSLDMDYYIFGVDVTFQFISLLVLVSSSENGEKVLKEKQRHIRRWILRKQASTMQTKYKDFKIWIYMSQFIALLLRVLVNEVNPGISFIAYSKSRTRSSETT